jgi:hypothetical protein
MGLGAQVKPDVACQFAEILRAELAEACHFNSSARALAFGQASGLACILGHCLCDYVIWLAGHFSSQCFVFKKPE